MRNIELKFRVWTKIGRGWVVGSNIHERWGVFTPYNTLVNSFREEDLIWQQSTCLNDINGRDIYEGDIISCDEYLGDSLKDGHHEKALVIFKDAAFWYSLDGGQNPHQLLMYGTNVKVIGNFFETPELLEAVR